MNNSAVSLIVISHSPQIAHGILELTGEFASGVKVCAVGGTKAGTLGADFDLTLEVLVRAVETGEAVVLTDLGSTWMTAKMAIETLTPSQQGRLHLSEAALVEGAIAAAAAIAAGFSASEILEQLEPLKLPK